jgi:Flp pilus assembly pilin Flp
MATALKLISKLRRDEKGAALIEYTFLLAVMILTVIATIGLVGTWISQKWTGLEAALP